MPLNTRAGVAAQNAAVNAVAPLLNSGYLRIYDGTQPANADTAITTQVLLAELTFNATAFGAASAGSATANAISQDSSANATGTAAWFRALQSNGTTAVIDGSVGTATSNIVLNSVAIQINAAVSVSAFTLALPMQGA